MPDFEPIGEVARWRIIYQLLLNTDVDQVLTYERMGEALELDPVLDRHTMQLAMRRAAKEFEESDKHALRAVPGKGYRVLQAAEHLDEAHHHQGKTRRSLVRARSKVDNVDFNDLDATSRKAFELVGQAIGIQQEVLQRLAVRQADMERSIETVQRRHEQDIQQINARLQWLEQQQQEAPE